MANLGPKDLERVAAAAPGAVTVALGSFGDRISASPYETIAGIPTLYAGDQGKRLAEMRLFLDGRKLKQVVGGTIFLTPRYPEDPETRALVDRTLAQVREAMKVSPPPSRQATPGAVVIQNSGGQASAKLLTGGTCLKCHEAAHRVWSASAHARAMETLVKANQDFNPECLRCHTTGFGAAEGFQSTRTTPALINVQCEACHGSGALHVQDVSKPYGRVAPRTCYTCHTKENSPEFSFFKYWETIRH